MRFVFCLDFSRGGGSLFRGKYLLSSWPFSNDGYTFSLSSSVMVTSPWSLLSLLLLDEVTFLLFLTFLSVVVNWYSTSAIVFENYWYKQTEKNTEKKNRKTERRLDELENEKITNENYVGKASFPNASRLQQSHVQTANIAFRLKRRVQWHTVSGRRTPVFHPKIYF